MLIALPIFLNTACTNLRDLTPEQFRTPEFFIKKVTLNTSVKRIKEMHGLYLINNLHIVYSHQVQLLMDHNETNATVLWQRGGLAKMATMALIDFEQPNIKNNTVVAKIYAASPGYVAMTESFLNTLNYKIN
jgi:hypothetical protein